MASGSPSSPTLSGFRGEVFVVFAVVVVAAAVTVLFFSIFFLNILSPNTGSILLEKECVAHIHSGVFGKQLFYSARAGLIWL